MGKFSVLVFFLFLWFFGGWVSIDYKSLSFLIPWTLPNVSVSCTLAPQAASTLNYIICENVENPCPLPLLPNLFFQRTKICQEIREYFVLE
jgi:hypothetical protein